MHCYESATIPRGTSCMLASTENSIIDNLLNNIKSRGVHNDLIYYRIQQFIMRIQSEV